MIKKKKKTQIKFIKSLIHNLLLGYDSADSTCSRMKQTCFQRDYWLWVSILGLGLLDCSLSYGPDTCPIFRPVGVQYRRVKDLSG